MKHTPWLATAAVIAVLAMTGCAGRSAPATSQAPGSTPPSVASATTTPIESSAPQTTAPSQSAIAPEKNPPGDIPDTQVFVAYAPAGAGLAIKVPEGWSRTTGASDAKFTDKLNMIDVTWTAAPSAPTLAEVQTIEVAKLAASAPAFQLQTVKAVRLPAGDAFEIAYRENGEPNPVTGKRYRLDVLRFIFFQSGKVADLTLSSPVGADNVDPWNTVSRSFSWR
jgi:hypothetical protein